LKYTPEGGQVSMRVEESGGQLAMEFVDNGIGIREDEHEKIFEKFYRAKDKRIAGITGSGLGLALAREVARLHGGDIVVRSQTDKGSTFILTLPIGKGGSSGAAPSGSAGGAAAPAAKAA
jgi:signal transduction histidine kinase